MHHANIIVNYYPNNPNGERSQCCWEGCFSKNIDPSSGRIWTKKLPAAKGRGNCYHPSCWDKCHSEVNPHTFDSAYYSGLKTPIEDQEAESLDSIPVPEFKTPDKPDTPHVAPNDASAALEGLAKVLLGPLAGQLGSLTDISTKVDKALLEGRVKMDQQIEALNRIATESWSDEKLIDMIAKHAPIKASKIEVSWNGDTSKLEGLVHKDIPEIAEMLLVSREVYAYGAAGAGKTFMSKQIADLLGLDFQFFQFGKMSPESVIKGFIDGNGQKQEQRFLNSVPRKCLIVIDEFDRTPSHIAVLLNSLLANGYIDARGHEGPIFRGQECYILALGNTTMRGRDEYFPEAVAQEFPTLDRFKFYHVEYDADLETSISNGINPACRPWVKWVQALRPEAMSGKHGKVFATPRATYDGCKLLSHTSLSTERIVDATVFKGLDRSTRDKLVAQFPLTPVIEKRESMRVKS